jgi:uncharacterized protein YceH (UPF0502 family)
MTSWVKRWIPLLSLAVVPIAQAQSAGAMDTARQATADATRSATPVNDSEEQQIQALKKEVASLTAALNSEQSGGEVRNAFPEDPDSHPLWP